VYTSGNPPKEEESLIFSLRGLFIAQLQILLSSDGVRHIHEEDSQAE